MTRTEGMTVVADRGSLVVSVPLAMKRRRGRKEVIAPEGAGSTDAEEARTNRGLALTIARAHRWRRLLEEGHYRSIRELALAVGVDNSYVARLLRLTLLSPNIIEAILEGTEPDGLSLERLYRAPAHWGSQHEAFCAALPPGSPGAGAHSRPTGDVVPREERQ